MTSEHQGLVKLFKASAANFDMWKPGETVIAAVSGGPDSMAMLHLLHAAQHETGFRLICAHANHGLRSEESQKEERLVEDEASKLGLAFRLGRLDVKGHKSRFNLGTQEAARELRYRFLLDTARETGASSIVLAHHAGDQAETVLFHFLRGSGLAGLSGMRAVREIEGVRLLRPLLQADKSELLSFCQRNRIPYAEDSSNQSADYTRNSLRLEAIPFLQRYNGRLQEALNRLAETAGAEDEYLESQTVQAYKSLCREKGTGTELDTAAFTALPFALQRRLVKLILNYLSEPGTETDFAKVELVRRKLVSPEDSTWTLDLGYGRTCTREYTRAFFRLGRPEPLFLQAETFDRKPGIRTLRFGESLGMIFREERSIPDMGALTALDREEAAFDADRLDYPLTVRSRLPGDRIELPRGAGTKKVKDLLIDEKIAPSERGLIPVVCDARGKILWIAGLRRSDHAWVDARSEKILYIRIDRALC